MEFINSHTKESIDMDYVLGKIFPRTPYGLQKKRELKPFMPGEEHRLEQELDEVESFIKIMESYDQSLREISHVLNSIKEIRTSISRAGDGIMLDEVEFFEIKNFIMDLRDISREQRNIQLFPEDTRIDDPVFLRNLLDPEGLDNRTFYIYDSYSEKLKTIRERKNMLQRQLEHERNKIVSQIQECLGVIPRLSGEITISKKDEEMLRRARECPYIIKEGSTTLTTIFRSRKNEDILNLQEEIESLKLLEEQEEYRVKKGLSEEIGKNSRLMFDMTERIGYLTF
jgi:dsDNA-specific endonuclease/ATPase MutS2